MLLELLNFVIGIAFGFFHKEKEDLLPLLKNGAIIGIILGMIFVIISAFLLPMRTSTSAGFFEVGSFGMFGIFITIIIFVVIFIIGTFIGDLLERKLKK